MKQEFKQFVVLTALCVLALSSLYSCQSSGNKKHASGPSADSYQQACEKHDFEKAHSILGQLREVFVNQGLPHSYYKLVSDIYGYQNYVDADIYIFREEAAYLMSLNDSNTQNRILKLIMETPLDGRQLDEGYCDYYDAQEQSVTGGEKVWLYFYCLKRINQKCDIVLDLAILNGNQSLAKKVLSFYKDNMHIEAGSSGNKITVKGKTISVDGNHGYIWYDSADKDAAKKRYDEAVKNGVFD